MLTEGFVPAAAILDEERRTIFPAGRPVTAEALASVRGRNVRTVLADDADWQIVSKRLAESSDTSPESSPSPAVALPQRRGTAPAKHGEADAALDVLVAELDDPEIRPSNAPFADRLQSHGATPYDAATHDRAVERKLQTLDQLRDLLETLSGNRDVELDDLQRSTADTLEQAAEDLDLFVSLGINPGLDTTVFTHSTNVSVLAVAVGARLGLDAEALRDLGTGCLVQNAGMLQLDAELYESPRILSDGEFVEIAKHPLISTDLLYRNMKEVPIGVRMIVYQIHERCDGSGYPRGITGDKIHPLAKIAAVADAYVALVSPRPHRPALLPYHAMAKMLADVKAGLFDAQAVRALLNTVSLFPIGSYVELNNTLVGKTIRANGAAYDRPIIEVWRRNQLTATPQIVDLTKTPELKVVKPLTALR